jgi:glycerol-3-phosphate acyltransferase PlsY
MLTVILTLLALIPFYLLGCFPSARLVGQRAGIEITEHGSGNPGAANVARVLGLRAGLTVLVADTLKGALAVLSAGLISQVAGFPAQAGLAAVLGHCFSLPRCCVPNAIAINTRGGKGVATALGVSLVLAPVAAGVALTVFTLSFWRTGIASLSSVLAAAVLPMVLFLSPSSGTNAESTQVCLSLTCLLVILRHKENLLRLVQGEEQRFRIASISAQDRSQTRPIAAPTSPHQTAQVPLEPGKK